MAQTLDAEQAAPSREFIEQIVRLDSERRPAVHQAYEERNRDLEQGWKAPLQATEVWGVVSSPAGTMAVALHAASMTYHESYARDPRASDIEPLLAAVRSPGTLGLANPASFAHFLELLHARTQPLKPGRSGAYLARWQNPEMAAALMAEIGFAIWRVTNGKQQPPRYERDAIVEKVIEQMPAYKRLSEGGKEDFREGVHEKLRKSKTTRLEVPKSALEGIVDNAVKQAAEDKELGESEREDLRERLRRLLRL